MVSKTYSSTGAKCRVTFKLDAVDAAEVAVLGEFNAWEPRELSPRKDGSYSTSFWVEAGQAYRFKYLLDGERWLNDDQADGFAPNEFGEQDALLRL